MFIFRMLASKLMTILSNDRDFKNMYTFPDIAGKYFWLYGSWEAWNIKILKQHFFSNSSDALFLDIGANLGCYTINLAEIFREVWSFEPAPIASSILYANVEANEINNCVLLTKGVANKNGTIPLNVVPADSGLSSIKNKVENSKQIEIEIVRLDDAVPLDESVAFIKIDVEGFELDVLMGAEEILRRNEAVIQIEVDGAQEIEKAKDIVKFLKSCGYSKFYQRKDNAFNRIKRRFYIQDTEIEPLQLKVGKFYQAVWVTK